MLFYCFRSMCVVCVCTFSLQVCQGHCSHQGFEWNVSRCCDHHILTAALSECWSKSWLWPSWCKNSKVSPNCTTCGGLRWSSSSDQRQSQRGTELTGSGGECGLKTCCCCCCHLLMWNCVVAWKPASIVHIENVLVCCLLLHGRILRICGRCWT